MLGVIRDEALVANAATVGAYLRERLRAVNHPAIGDVRGAGLFIGVELVRDRATKARRRSSRPASSTACATGAS